MSEIFSGKPRQKRYYEQLLMIQSEAQSPWSRVRYVKQLEIRGASDKDTVFVDVQDHTRKEQPEPRVLKGSGRHFILVSQGAIRIRPKLLKNPITVIAHCEK